MCVCVCAHIYINIYVFLYIFPLSIIFSAFMLSYLSVFLSLAAIYSHFPTGKEMKDVCVFVYMYVYVSACV